MSGVIPCEDVLSGDARDFARSALKLVRAVRHGAPDNDLMCRFLALAGQRLSTLRWAVHVRQHGDGDWSLAGHGDIRDSDAATLAALNAPPSPLDTAYWATWQPIVLERAPWPGLSAELDGPCVCMPVTFIDGEVTGCVTVFSPPCDAILEALDDVAVFFWTARTRGRHEAMMTAQTGQYLALANHSADTIWRLDLQHRIVYANRGFALGSAANHQACVGCHVLEHVPESVRATWITALRAITTPESLREFYYSVGDRRFVARLAPEVDAREQVVGILASISDITRDFHLELDRMAAEIRCQVVTDVTRSVIYERRLSDEKAYVSPSVETVFGYSADEASRGGLA
ncbi:MAG TPA: PAS domain-containing protein, partial [Gemmatimonadaceae bacterium]|nr:PAS domain-containing protein [Gemmatimonadaceae bacterium]